MFEKEFDSSQADDAERYLRYLRFAYPSYRFTMKRMSDADFELVIRGVDRFITDPETMNISAIMK